MITGVLLAAGRSQRMGQPKLLLPWQGMPLIRFVAQQALQTRLDELVVVVGHRADHVIAALEGLTVRIVHNPDFLDGQSTSLKAGILAVQAQASAAVVLLADQPFVQPQTVDALIERAVRDRALIVVPRFEGRRGNPVFFDRRLFPELLTMSGDQGARSVVLAHQEAIHWLDTADGGILLDIDTPEIYAQLAAQNEPDRRQAT